MTSKTLFSKLEEYELELGRLEKHKEQDKKLKNLSLKVDLKTYNQDDDLKDGENITLLVTKFGKIHQERQDCKIWTMKKFCKENRNFNIKPKPCMFQMQEARSQQSRLSIS